MSKSDKYLNRGLCLRRGEGSRATSNNQASSKISVDSYSHHGHREAGHRSRTISKCKPGPNLLLGNKFEHHKDRTPSHGYAEHEAAMAAFAKTWRE